MAAKKRKKPRRIRLRFRKGDHAHNLQAAAQAWLIANGGDAVVIGGIGIMPDFGVGKFNICIGIVGTPPKKLEASDGK